MSIPKRHSSSESIVSGQRTFFVTTSTDGKRALLQSERSATLLIDVMFHYRDRGEYKLHDFVVMRNHFHAQITLDEHKSVERAMQLIKGGFSYRARKELGMKRTIWQRGFSEHCIPNAGDYVAHKDYIWQNAVKAGLGSSAVDYPHCSASGRFRFDPVPEDLRG